MKTKVRTYDELAKYTTAFAKGGYNLLFLIGNPGQSKSQTLKDHMGRSAKKRLWVEGTVSAFQLYQMLYANKDQPLVMDDVDSIYTDRNLVRLLKCLCNTDREKKVSWNTASPQLNALNIPNDFVTTSKVCIIANHWQTLSQHVGSLNDRGLMVEFEPTPEEIHRKAKTFFKDKEIIAFIESYIPCLTANHSLRHYVNSLELKLAGLDWKKVLLETLGLYEVVTYQQVMAKKFPLVEQSAREFQKITGLSRPMFFDAAKMFKEVESRLPKLAKPKTKPKVRKRSVATATA